AAARAGGAAHGGVNIAAPQNFIAVERYQSLQLDAGLADDLRPLKPSAFSAAANSAGVSPTGANPKVASRIDQIRARTRSVETADFTDQVSSRPGNPDC